MASLEKPMALRLLVTVSTHEDLKPVDSDGTLFLDM